MNRTAWGVIVLVALGLALIPAWETSAQGLSSQVIVNYLDRMRVNWKRSDRNPNVFTVTRTAGLKRAERVEIIIRNDPKQDEVQLLAYPMVRGEYMAFAKVGDQAGLSRAMLQRNEDAFGAYFLDSDGDLGFKYVFTTESGLGYEAFSTVVNELFRIADDPMLKLIDSYR